MPENAQPTPDGPASRMHPETQQTGSPVDLLAPGEPDMRMDAYYYSFTPTGVGIVDRILSAVATAGKRNHNTDMWADETYATASPDCLTHEQRIQRAADEAADSLRTHLTRPEPLTASTAYDHFLLGQQRLIEWLNDPANAEHEDMDPLAVFITRIQAQALREASEEAYRLRLASYTPGPGGGYTWDISEAWLDARADEFEAAISPHEPTSTPVTEETRDA